MDPDAMTESERLAKKRYDFYYVFERMTMTIEETLRQAIHRGCRRHTWHNMFCFECIALYQSGLFTALVDAQLRIAELENKLQEKKEIPSYNCIEPIAYKVRRKNDGVEYGPFETLQEANIWMSEHNELICIYPGQEI